MASFYGLYSTDALNSVPSVKVDVTNWGAKVRSVYDKYTLTATNSNGDKYYMGRLPKGAKVIGARLVSADLGSAGVLDVGYEYVNSADGATVDDAFFASVDVHTAASQNLMVGTEAGYMYELAGEANIIVTADTAWTATSGSFQLQISYVLE